MNAAIIEAQVFPPVQFFSKYFVFDQIILDTSERFEKQSYRNRFQVLGANKVLDLIVPVHKGKTRLTTSEVRVSYHHDWKREHLQAIKSAYGKSPFFDHYFPQIEALYQKPQDLLFNWALQSIKWAENAIGLESLAMVGENEHATDLKGIMHPKERYQKPDPSFKATSYFQCFSHSGFVANLSVLDLIFNEGPNSVEVVRNSVVRG